MPDPAGMDISSHSRRVGDYCGLIVARLGARIDPETLAGAARLHDVGMASAEAVAAHTPAELDADARSALQSHTYVGHALLHGSASPLLDLAAEIALGHHERFDGTGYPNRLRGTDIPLAARITAVADTFDAITTDRPYRRAAPVRHAQDVLEAGRDGQFDAHVVNAFLDVLDAAVGVLRRHPPATDRADAAPPGLTLTAAATMLGITPTRLRRWSDEGRIEAIRTAGGHRRFRRQAVQQLAAELGRRPRLRHVVPPGYALPQLAGLLRDRGTDLAQSAAASLYEDAGVGWFKGDAAAVAVPRWLTRTATACEHGAYETALGDVALLVQVAEANGATLLERHAFLERFGQSLLRALVDGRASHHELTGARRLLVALQHAALAAGEVIEPS